MVGRYLGRELFMLFLRRKQADVRLAIFLAGPGWTKRKDRSGGIAKGSELRKSADTGEKVEAHTSASYHLDQCPKEMQRDQWTQTSC